MPYDYFSFQVNLNPNSVNLDDYLSDKTEMMF